MNKGKYRQKMSNKNWSKVFEYRVQSWTKHDNIDWKRKKEKEWKRKAEIERGRG